MELLNIQALAQDFNNLVQEWLINFQKTYILEN